MPITKENLQELLEGHFPDGNITLTDLAGDNDHWEAKIESSAFAGKSRVQQHQMVFEAVKGHDIHALSIKTEEKQGE